MKSVRKAHKEIIPELWNATVSLDGEMMIGECRTTALAAIHGTPLHVVNRDMLVSNAESIIRKMKLIYPGTGKAHYAFKCNPVPGIIGEIRRAGLKAEVMSEFELFLAVRAGYKGDEIIVNGPCKHEHFLHQCLDVKVKLIILDSLGELALLGRICEERNQETGILLRINPDFVPGGMNSGSATASRRGSALGLDITSGEAETALKNLSHFKRLHFYGLHFHIGSGIRYPGDYFDALCKLKPLIGEIEKAGKKVGIIDVGGGFGVSGSREMTSFEMLKYQSLGRLPAWTPFEINLPFESFITEITKGMLTLFKNRELPELIIEPGRSVTSSCQSLLISVHQVKKRKGLNTWIITDGGIGTVTMPLFYEFHQIFLCNDIYRRPKERVIITGPGCFAGDIVYRNILMPELQPGEILAVMDSGAYFTSWESSFSHPLPAIVSVSGGRQILIRKRQTFGEMLQRDKFIDFQQDNS